MALSFNPIPQSHPMLRRVVDALGNLASLVGLWFAYKLVREVSADDMSRALVHAGKVIDLQRWLGLPEESGLQQAVLGSVGFIKAMNVFYIGFHFPVTVLVLLWTLFRHRDHYTRIRNAMLTLSALGLVLHVVFPLAPPRMLSWEGYIDTAKIFGPDPYKTSLGSAANQIAAMPSLHVGWALLVALSVITVMRTRWRYLAVLHPIVTMGVVILTANHYWLDAIVAVVLTVASWQLFRPSRPGAPEHVDRGVPGSDQPQFADEAYRLNV